MNSQPSWIKAGLFHRKPKSLEWLPSGHNNEFCGNGNIQIKSNLKTKQGDFLEIKHMGKFIPKNMPTQRANNIFYKLELVIKFENEEKLLDVNIIFKIDNNKTYQIGTSRINELIINSSNFIISNGNGKENKMVQDSFKHSYIARINEFNNNLLDIKF